MSKVAKNWTLTNPTASSWVTLVGETATIAAIVIANNSAGSPTDRAVQIRLVDTSTSPVTVLSRFVPEQTFAAGDTKTLDLRSLSVTVDQAVEVYADGDDVDYLASGVVDA